MTQILQKHKELSALIMSSFAETALIVERISYFFSRFYFIVVCYVNTKRKFQFKQDQTRKNFTKAQRIASSHSVIIRRDHF